MTVDELILVNEADEVLGFDQKLPIHQDGRLHRAFSVFIYNRDGQILLQRRALSKYHFGGIWANTCCSHPRRGQEVIDAARQRLKFEMGIEADLREAFSFIYRAEDPVSGLIEHELDHVVVGTYDGEPQPNADEVQDWRWMTPAELWDEIRDNPDAYSPWLKIALDKLEPR